MKKFNYLWALLILTYVIGDILTTFYGFIKYGTSIESNNIASLIFNNFSFIGLILTKIIVVILLFAYVYLANLFKYNNLGKNILVSVIFIGFLITSNNLDVILFNKNILPTYENTILLYGVIFIVSIFTGIIQDYTSKQVIKT